MFHAALIALVTLAAPGGAAPARVLLKSAAASAPRCKVTRMDDKTVRASLFSADAAACPVAVIGDDRIALEELAQAVEGEHLARNPATRAPARRPEMDYGPALDRLITSRLLVLEAREMRLDQQPDYRKAVEEFSSQRLRAMLQREAVRGVKPPAAEVTKLYNDKVREWKVKSVLLEKDEDAKAFATSLEGGDFDKLAKQFVDAKKAKGGGPAEFVPPQHLLPELRDALAGAKQGQPIGPLKVPSGWVVMRIDGVRYPAGNVQARNEARAAAQARAEHEAIRGFYLGLVKKYAVVDQKLLASLDLEAGGEQGFAKLLEDKRPLVTIQGEAPVTVGDLARAASMKFFHGLAGPIAEKKVNREKDPAFEKLLGSRLFAKEAAVRKLASRPAYRQEMAAYERALAFNTLVEKVIAPDVKVTERDALEFYEQNKGQFTAPQMYKLDGFAFRSDKDAKAALDKLKAGTDYAWLRSNATAQIAPEERSLQLDGQTLSASALPKGLAAALTGAKSGEYRLYAHAPTEVYVMRVVDQTPPTPQPYADAREDIAKKLFQDRMEQAVREYGARLRKAQPVEVLLAKAG